MKFPKHNTEEDREYLKDMHAKGKQIQFFAQLYRGHAHKWHDCVDNEPSWHPFDIYRVKPDDKEKK